VSGGENFGGGVRGIRKKVQRNLEGKGVAVTKENSFMYQKRGKRIRLDEKKNFQFGRGQKGKQKKKKFPIRVEGAVTLLIGFRLTWSTS